MPQPTLAQLGAAIRRLRNQRQMTLENLADATEMHFVSIARIETGNQNLTWTTLTEIATALEIDVIELTRLATEQTPADD